MLCTQDLGNSIYYELNCILHLVQDGSNATCHYYRLCRDSEVAAASKTIRSVTDSADRS